jgi:hypothetical protein
MTQSHDLPAGDLIGEARRVGCLVRWTIDGRISVTGENAARFVLEIARQRAAVAKVLERELRAAHLPTVRQLLREIVTAGGEVRIEDGQIMLWMPKPLTNSPRHEELTERVRTRLYFVVDALDIRYARAAFDIPPAREFTPSAQTRLAWLAIEDETFSDEQRLHVARLTMEAEITWPDHMPAFKARALATSVVALHDRPNVAPTMPPELPVEWKAMYRW